MTDGAFYEDARQEALTLSLGQVQCIGGHEDWWIGSQPCPWCRAVI